MTNVKSKTLMISLCFLYDCFDGCSAWLSNEIVTITHRNKLQKYIGFMTGFQVITDLKKQWTATPTKT